MGWEQRGSGRYYYRKKRVGRRVVSEYMGRGEHAEAVAQWDRLDRISRTLDRENSREEFERMRQEAEDTDALLDELEDTISVLTGAYLVTHGCHKHKGQWRRRENDR